MMCSLALFPPPLPSGQATLCESNNELLAMTNTEDQPKQVRFKGVGVLVGFTWYTRPLRFFKKWF